MLSTLVFRVLFAIESATSKLTDEEGQTLAEYGLIMAVIAVAVIALAVIAFRDAIIGAFGRATTCLSGSC